MDVLPTRLAGLVLLQPRVIPDGRGFFLETYSRESYHAAGVEVDFVQDNHSRSRRGVIRGLHLQRPPGQPKLVRCSRGRIFDVAVDVRPGSPTFGAWEGFELDDVRHRQLYLPAGFAHGFQALDDLVDVAYKVASPYEPEAELGIRWDDPDIGVEWPVREAVVSERDQASPTLRAVRDAGQLGW
jgi:dTDP-4-dehydrorhamnose 3,5-epimerase